MKNDIIASLIVLLLIIFPLNGCINAGTHGSIKSYDYPVRKRQLQAAIEYILANNKKLHRDTIKQWYIDNSKGKSDTVWNDYYNDGNTYVTLKIDKNNVQYNYTFRYAGDSLDWDRSMHSSISIAYAWDDKHVGGSDGDGIPWYKPWLRRHLTELFEKELVSKVDSVLGR